MRTEAKPDRRFFSPWALALLAAALVLAAAPGRAQITPDSLCTGDPCIISRDATIDPGAVLQLDFGARRVIVEAVLNTGGTVVTFLAGSFEIRNMGQIRGNAGVTVATSGNIAVNGTRSTGALRLIGPNEGTLMLQSSAGSVTSSGRIFVDSDTAESSGGTLHVSAATRIELRGDITARGGTLAGGGAVDLDTPGDVLVAGGIDLSGGEDDAGGITVRAGGAARFEGPMVIEGGGDQGGGGDVDVSAGGDVSFLQSVRMRGSSLGPSSCGDGGLFDVVAGGTLTVAAEIDLRSRIGDCLGGIVDIDAADVALSAALLVDARGIDGSGGDLSIDVANGFDCRALLNASGDTGGSVALSSDAALTLSSACMVDASGVGGQVDVEAVGNVTLQGRLAVGSVANTSALSASFNDIRGCRIDVRSGALLRSLGTGAENLLTARSTITVAGTVEATFANAFFLPVGFMALVSGSVTPQPLVINNPQSVACETPPPTATSTATLPPGVTPTTTPTHTPTPSPSPTGDLFTATPTATATPSGTPVCAGDCDADGEVTLAEVVTGVNIALGSQPLSRCPALDADHSDTIEIREPVVAVANLMEGCFARTPAAARRRAAAP